MVTEVGERTIHDLPEEILSHIFSFLDVEDRLWSVRLTCKFWYSCCNHLSLVKNEKLVFSWKKSESDQQLLVWDPLQIQNCIDIAVNFEFINSDFTVFPVFMWTVECFSRIQSLNLNGCVFYELTFTNIIRYCFNLEELRIHLSRHLFEPCECGFVCTIRSLNTFIRDKFTHRKLRTLEIFHDDTRHLYFPNSICEKMFLLFPFLNSFSCGISYNRIRSLLYNSCQFFRVDVLDQKTVTGNDDRYLSNIKELIFNIPSRCRWMEFLISKVELKLKKFETIFVYHESTRTRFIQFLCSQTELMSVRIIVVLDNQRTISKQSAVERLCSFVKELLFQLLESCRNLKKLCISSVLKIKEFWLNSKEYADFLLHTSKLIELEIDTFPNLREPTIVIPVEFQMLRTLKINSFGNEDFFVTLMGQYSNLRYLDLGIVTDVILQEIFKVLTNLKTLKLRNTERCTDFGFIGFGGETHNEFGYSIQKLTYLEHLEINLNDETIEEGYCQNEGKWLHELRFQHLKYIQIPVSLCAVEDFCGFHRYTPITDNLMEACTEVQKISPSVVCTYMRETCFLWRENFNCLGISVGTILNECPSLKKIKCVNGISFWMIQYNRIIPKISISYCNDRSGTSVDLFTYSKNT